MASERLEDILETLREDNCSSHALTLKRLRTVLKIFASYSTTADSLPPPTLIPICLFSVPNIFLKLLNFDENDVLTEEPKKISLKLCIQLYVKGLLRLLGECQQQIKHVVVQSMSKSILLTPAYPILARKWVRALITVWATSSENLNLGLRCFVTLERLLRHCSEEFYMWALRRAYIGFFEHCGQVSWRNLEHINFMGNCFCQLAKINTTRSYYVLFGYLRSLAVQIHSLNSLKGKYKSELSSKLYSQQTLQVLRLFMQIVSKAGDEELSALTYPLSEIINAYEHISESPQYLPLKLHLVQIELQLMEATGLYLPHVFQSLLKVLKSAPLQKKLSKKAGVEGSIELGYHLSQQQLRNTNYINDIFNKAVYYLYWLHAISSKTVAGTEIARQIAKNISQIEFGYSGYTREIKVVAKIFKNDADKIEALRSKRKMALGDKAIQKFESLLSSGKVILEGREKYKDLLHERENLLKAKVLAEHQDDHNEEEDEEEVQEDEEELQSGWEEASQGASEFEEEKQPKQKKQEGQDLEDISYSGDPEDASEAAKEWSEQAWSSQEELEK